VPALIPLTVPALFIVATVILLLVQFPPAALSDRAVVAPLQIAVAPPIGDAGRFTVTVIVPVVMPHILESV